jgi:hypothetical protein
MVDEDNTKAELSVVSELAAPEGGEASDLSAFHQAFLEMVRHAVETTELLCPGTKGDVQEALRAAGENWGEVRRSLQRLHAVQVESPEGAVSRGVHCCMQ